MTEKMHDKFREESGKSGKKRDRRAKALRMMQRMESANFKART
ncbi:hypothetical protein SIID45300_01028 [Candidatus Magnetaquicoccaceae bacterium FCR-1]|uniref:Uncharacterized protein n=1 Tax=Candidatus Magnetaquiglobus chichijimensis TaxID=3141448 RepID=A0ABQ0C752_9PROT